MEDFEFVGGAPCLDFVNTVGGHRAGAQNEMLGDYSSLVDWAAAGDFLTKADAAQLHRRAHAAPDEAVNILIRALELREAVYDVLTKAIEGKPVRRADLSVINREFQNACMHQLLQRRKTEWMIGWDAMGDTLDSPLWAPAQSIVTLLRSNEFSRVQECSSETCGWVFLDSSKNRSRRWCDMKVCGNREKARRFRS